MAPTVADNIEQRNAVGCACEIAQDLDLPFDFVPCDGFQDLDHTALAVDRVNSFKDLLWALGWTSL